MLSKKIGIDNITKHIKNARVLMRVDFNVPMKEGKVKDAGRIAGTIPSIKKILSENPKNIVLMSHMGRPDGHKVDKYSLKPLIPKIEELLGTKVTFLSDCVGKVQKFLIYLLNIILFNKKEIEETVK